MFAKKTVVFLLVFLMVVSVTTVQAEGGIIKWIKDFYKAFGKPLIDSLVRKYGSDQLANVLKREVVLSLLCLIPMAQAITMKEPD